MGTHLDSRRNDRTSPHTVRRTAAREGGRWTNNKMEMPTKGYDFTLTHGQRLCSLIAEWWAPGIILCIVLTVGIPIAVSHPICASFFAFCILFVFRGLIFGLFNLLNNGRRHVEIEENGVGFGSITADLWIFTDGIKQIRQNRWGTTSIRHHNGTYVDVPTALLSSEDYQKLENGLKKYHDYWKIKEQTKRRPT